MLDVVWTENKQIKLVDSLYHNYYVPPIVFAIVLDEDGEEVRRCVDGKQRLTSIQKFIDGQVSGVYIYKWPPDGTFLCRYLVSRGLHQDACQTEQ